MDTTRTLSALLLATAFAGAADAATLRPTPAMARTADQERRIDVAAEQGRITPHQVHQLQAAREALARQAREMAGQPHPDVMAQLALSHRLDRLDWAIQSGNTQFLHAHQLAMRG